MHQQIYSICKFHKCVLKVPVWQEEGQGVQSLYGVTMQSLLQGRRHGLTVSGRRLSGHLHIKTIKQDVQMLRFSLEEAHLWIMLENKMTSLTQTCGVHEA